MNFNEKDYFDTEKKKKIIEEMTIDLKTNPRYHSFFSKYSEKSIDHFIAKYPEDKLRWLYTGGKKIKSREESEISLYSQAEKCFDEILQKKLFNLQCKWRSEQITLENVEITNDFLFWGKNLHTCPFLEPVTKQELELYMQYLVSDSYEFYRADEWQDYDAIKEETVTDLFYSTPEWYEFYDSRCGTGVLLTLPDIRGEKEKKYCDKLFDENEKKRAEADKDKLPEKPYFMPFDSEMEQFLETFEPPYVTNCYKAYMGEQGEKSLDDDFEMQNAIDILLNANRTVSILFDMDWRQAIIKTAARYENENLCEILPQVHEQYLQKRELGILPQDAKPGLLPKDDYIRQLWVTNIFNGRKLFGEEEDFNF